jgi:hypothetical protein
MSLMGKDLLKFDYVSVGHDCFVPVSHDVQ